MPLCEKCVQFFENATLDYRIAGLSDDLLHHGYLLEFLESVDQKCFVCWRLFQYSFDKPAKARKLLGRIAEATSGEEREAEREWLSMQRRHVTAMRGSCLGSRRQDRLRPMWNKDYLEGLKVSHPDLIDLRPVIEEAEKLIKSETQDDNGRGAGTFLMVPREQFGMIAALSNITDSDETFSMLNFWIKQCELEHDSCRRSKSRTPWYPTRLLDVGTQGSKDVKLVPGNQAAAAGQEYMTLSHRWGASTVLKLAAAVITDWANGLPVQSLSKAFQDFISLARRLNIRYVWIDSLCIIQEGDDGADWRSEALTMNNIYMHSYCNISADWGSDTRGLFFPRDLRVLDMPIINVRFKRENTDSIVTEECSLVESDFWEAQVSRSPLSSRGWVVQERWLSTRNLRFGPREVFFECGQHTLCERFPEKLPKVLCEGDVVLKSAFGVSQLFRGPIAGSLEQATPGTALYDAWDAILRKYSSCSLTYGSDRLIAFTGIAKSFRTMLDDRYIAGLWLRNLLSEMMWFRNRLATTAVIDDPKDDNRLFEKPQTGQYIAPSFSWASTAVPVVVNHLETNLGFLVSASCIKYRSTLSDPIEEWTEDIFGPMSSPTIEVMVIGSLRKMRLLPYYDGEDTALFVVPDGPNARFKALEAWSKQIQTDALQATLDFQVRNNDLEAFIAGTDFYYMPWQDHWDPCLPADPEHKRDQSFTGLMLELIDSRMCRFRRIGRMWTYGRQDRDLCIAEQGNESILPCAHYDETTKQHTIYIV